MAQWLGYAPWLSAWLVLVLGQAWVQGRPLCEAVHGDSSAPPSSFDFNSFETRSRTVLRRGAHVWRRGHATGRLRESCGEPWGSREWSAVAGWALLFCVKGLPACVRLSAPWTVTLS